MLSFPNCKINLGLHVTEKRSDGFHNIETVFYPLNWCDALEITVPESGEGITLHTSGLAIDSPTEDNLLYKAWDIVRQKHTLPPLRLHLYKNIPMGAGLGGGSADAAFVIKMLNEQFNLMMSRAEMLEIASTLGSDCAFFIENRPLLATGRGNEFSEIAVNLSAYYILAVFPNVHSNTREAYLGLTPKKPHRELRSIIETTPPADWKNLLVNDFEESIFKKHPVIGEVKQSLYKAGALYASMSGSGSALYGIFNTEPAIEWPHTFKYCLQKPTASVL